jgi:hypothetical protein
MFGVKGKKMGGTITSIMTFIFLDHPKQGQHETVILTEHHVIMIVTANALLDITVALQWSV